MPNAERRLSADARAILAVQALRAFAYGLGSVLIGASLARSGLPGAEVGGVLASLLAGAALVSVLLARYGDRVGRRRCYRLLLLVMALAGAVFALTSWLPALILAGLTGTVSTDVVESGPFTSLEQAMLPHAAAGRAATRLFGTYNTIATLAGSLGALAAAASALVAGHARELLLAYPVVAAFGLVAAARLSPNVEVGQALDAEARPSLRRSRRAVAQLSALFALDSFAGGFVVQTFIAYLLVERYGASTRTLAILFFAIGLLQAGSFRSRFGWPSGSGCSARWSSRTCPRISCSPRSPSRRICRARSRFCSRASPFPRWMCRPGRRTSSPLSIRPSAPPRPRTRTPPATPSGRSRPSSPGRSSAAHSAPRS
jgi:MFS family permease